MEREIKFRGKHKNSDEWFFSMTIANGTIKRKKDDVFLNIGGDKWVGVEPETVGQFTGLKDKNGVDIYEHDNLLNTNTGFKGVVIYDTNRCYFNVTDNYPDTLYNCDMLNEPGNGWMAYEIEVIGNIHDK